MAGQTLTWNTGVTGDWTTTTNWSPQDVPAAQDTAIIGSGTVVVGGTVEGVSVVLGGSARGETVTLQSNGATFQGEGTGPSETNFTITVVGGNGFLPPINAIFLSNGQTLYDGHIFVQSKGGGLTIRSQSDGTTDGDFVLSNTDGKAVMTVGQESVLTLAGQTITNRGLVQVLGGLDIEQSVSLDGPGIVALEDGGQMTIAGTVGREQMIAFADRSGLVTLNGGSSFQGTFGFTPYPGARIDLASISAQSVSLSSSTAGGMTYHYLELHVGIDPSSAVVATLGIEQINPEYLSRLETFDLQASDFTLRSDGQGGTLVTYAPLAAGTQLQQSLPTPLIARANTPVALTTILEQSYGTSDPGFKSITLLATQPFTNTSTDIGYWVNPDDTDPEYVTPQWLYNGAPITGNKTIDLSEISAYSLKVGNQIINPAQFSAVVTDALTGPTSETITYNVWSVDPDVAAQAGLSGLPTADSVIASAQAFLALYGNILNTNLCNWIGDNVAAGAGAALPLPNAFLDPTLNVEGGFWRVAYKGTQASTPNQPAPVTDWGTLVQPGDIVRMGWFKPEAGGSGPPHAESGHTTTVLAIGGPNGTITVYDNNDYQTGTETIGVHQNVDYWLRTNPVDITIYRLDPNQQYLILGTTLNETIHGTVYNDLIRPGGGNDVITTGGIGADEIEATLAQFNGVTVTDLGIGDRLHVTDLNAAQAKLTFKNDQLVIKSGTQSATLTLPGSTSQAFVLTPDGDGGSFIDRLNQVRLTGTHPSGYVVPADVGRVTVIPSATVGGSGITTTGTNATAIVNLGTIAANDVSAGVTITGVGTLTNGSSTNATASIIGSNGVVLDGFGIVTNYGVIGGANDGAAVIFNSSQSRLIQYASGSLIGSVEGGGGALELARSALAGTLSGLGSRITGFASVEVDAKSAWTLDAGSLIEGGTTLANGGILGVAGALSNEGQIENQAGATLDLRGDFGIVGSGGLSNQGTLLKSAGNGVSRVQLATELVSTGRIVVQAGTLELAGAQIDITGRISGAGTIAFGSGTTIVSGQASITTAGLTISGSDAILAVADSLRFRGDFSAVSSSTLNLSTGADLRLSGATTLDAATIAGPGRLSTGGTTQASDVVVSGGLNWTNTGTMSIEGTLGFTGAGGTFFNMACGTVTLQGAADISAASFDTLFRNNGAVLKADSGIGTISATLINNGVVEVANGQLTLTGAVTGNGRMQIDSGQTLAINNAVSSGQTVAFSAGEEKLILGNAASFGGRLSDFGAGDRLVFSGFDASTATVAFSENGNATAGTLTISDATHQASIALLGQYAAAGFSFTAGEGLQTLVTYMDPSDAGRHNALYASAG